jgi:hypothetical protein
MGRYTVHKGIEIQERDYWTFVYYEVPEGKRDEENV